MKYVLLFLFASFVFLFIFIFYFLKGLWFFRFEEFKEQVEEYRMMWCSFVWKAFKKNVY